MLRRIGRQWLAVRGRGQAGQEARPAVVMQSAQVFPQAAVDKAKPGLAPAGTTAGECHLDPGGARRQPETGVSPAPGEDQAAGALDDEVLSLAELPGHDLEPEPAAWPRLKIGCDADPAHQLPGIGEHLEHLLRWRGQDDFVNHHVTVDHCRVSSPGAASPDCRLASRLPQNSSSIARNSARRSARTR